MQCEGVRNVPDSDPRPVHEHADHVEAIGVVPTAVPVDPDPRRTSQLLLLPPVDCFDWSPEPVPAPSLHFDEGHHPISLDHQIDVAMPGTEPALDDAPPPLPEPSLRDPLPQLAE